MYSLKEPSSPWCPYCGHSKKVTKPTTSKDTPTIVKSAEVIRQEDLASEQKCTGGGWYNPTTDKCMGSGVGFRKHS